ncbi:Hypothetical protein R9X50_00724500 [Acrodontium crateriforme]|uniref:Histone h1.3 n=1 Tax=Acrodontium crateriforme TaxID=150365 RepID=A0AAQ3MB27_9PEZI|nr:Hypothetical protein R9X50_00724500 [Acrodontium crateriforme]
MTTPNLTAGELKILQLSIYCYETQPKIDYKKLMEIGGYKTVASATTVYSAARKKLLAGVADGQVGGPAPAPSKKRSKAAVDGDDDETPPAKKRGRKPKVKDFDGATEDFDDEHPPAKKRGRKPKVKEVEVVADGSDDKEGDLKNDTVKRDDEDEMPSSIKEEPDANDADE